MIGSMPIEEFSYGIDVAGLDPASLGDALREVAADAMMDLPRMTAWLASLAVAQQTVGLNMLRRLGGEHPEPAAAPPAADRRFSDEAWRRNPFLHGSLEEYFVRVRAANSLVDSSRVPLATRRKAKFAIGLMMDALAPSNVPWLNPAVIKEAMETGGGSLVRGLENFLEDVQHNGGRPRQVDTSSFTVGRNLAATPGRIVMRNQLIELIAYEPQTAKVYEQPLLCSPPWINKYYIMDLAPGRSYVEWAVKHGFQTFAISYRNPDASMAALSMDDYLRLGVLAALECVEELTGAKQVNVAALCLGGTLTLLALAHLAALGQEQARRIGWATLTNSLIDFSEPGDLGIFADEAAIERLEKKTSARGFLEANEMAGTFDALRGNDLIWSYVVSNWFMGRKPPAFDILAWNGDSTRLPATMHSQYLRACYLHNAVVRPDEFSICGTAVDLGKIQTPLYVLGAEADHIAPWRGTYATTQHVGGETKFTLSSSGHVAGIVNPPGNPKAHFWTKAVAQKNCSPDDWRAASERVDGSWWEDWAAWACARSGKLIAPTKLPAGEPAPGRYVVDQTGPLIDPLGDESVEGPRGATASTRAKPARRRNGATKLGMVEIDRRVAAATLRRKKKK
ncbi:MAG: alpha/beta fold hydrolase [Candidatus Eremiobacteraeota bacterium]|nr:alpha/beta fold hydrolase [Candidatus Eremiobacteraeota bacterium]